MIVISSALALSPAYLVDANDPVIGWHNLVTPAGIDADYEAPGYPATRLGNPSTAEFWRSTTTDAQNIVVTIPGTRPIDYIALARHNLGSAQIPVLVETWDATEADFVEVAEERLLADDTALLIRFAEVTTTQVRIRLGEGGAPPEAAVLYVGKLLIVPNGIPPGHTPITMGRQSEILSGRSEAGDFLGRWQLRRTLSSSVSFQYLDGDWYRAEFDRFVVVAETRPWFFAWAPRDYPREVGLSWLDADPQPTIDLLTGEINVSLQYSAVAA